MILLGNVGAARRLDLSEGMKAKSRQSNPINELPDSGSGGVFMTRFEEVVLGLMLLQVVVQILSLFRK
jgi:hypothetical protein